jgi:predicted DNA-binding transcriptional regulator AlpA
MDKPIGCRALRPKTAASRLDISLSTFWEWAKNDPTFPRVFKLGPSASGVWEHELDAWLEARAAASVEAPRACKRGPGRGHKKPVETATVNTARAGRKAVSA